MAQQIICKYCSREYAAGRAGTICDGCGAALASEERPTGAEAPEFSSAPDQQDNCQPLPVLSKPAVSSKRRVLRFGVLASFVLLLAAGICTFALTRADQDTPQVVMVTVELAEPEPEPVPEEPAEREFDDDILFFYRTMMGEMNFLLGVLENLGDEDMELEEFYDWLESEDVILSQYDEILDRLAKKGVDVEPYAGLLESLAPVEETESIGILEELAEQEAQQEE